MLDEFEPVMMCEIPQILEATGLEIVDADHLRTAVQQPRAQIGADEPRATGHDNGLIIPLRHQALLTGNSFGASLQPYAAA
ncbi:hypothetical protein GCM10023325_20710 [Sphingomonas lutea]